MCLFLESPEKFSGPKAIRKTPTRLLCKAGLFICCKGNKNNCKVSCLETPSLWRYKENYVNQNAPEKFRDFWETSPRSRCRDSGSHKISQVLSGLWLVDFTVRILGVLSCSTQFPRGMITSRFLGPFCKILHLVFSTSIQSPRASHSGHKLKWKKTRSVA